MYGSGESSNFGTSQPHSAFSYPEQFRGLPQASNFALQQITQNLSGSTTEQRLPGNKRRQLVDDNDKVMVVLGNRLGHIITNFYR